MNKETQATEEKTASTDKSTKQRVCVVLARYKENVDWIDCLPNDFTVVIMNAGDNDADMQRARGLPNVKVLPSPNHGREGGHWMRYVLAHYDNLPEWSFMVQASPFTGHTAGILLEMKRPISGLFRTFGVDKAQSVSPGGDAMFGQVTWIVRPENMVPAIKGSWGGQHQVHKDAILRRPRSFYERLDEVSKRHDERFSYYFEWHWSVVYAIREEDYAVLP